MSLRMVIDYTTLQPSTPLPSTYRKPSVLMNTKFAVAIILLCVFSSELRYETQSRGIHCTNHIRSTLG